VSRVSVIIPAFNAASTIGDTIASVAAQTYGNWEIVVVDDGSSDATGEIVAGLAALEPRIRSIRQQNTGLAGARNRGHAESAGELLLFLDADDTIAPTHLDNLVQVIGSASDIVAYSGYSRVDEQLRVFTTVFDPSIMTAPFQTFAWRNKLAIHCVLIPRVLFASVGDFDPTLDTCEDWDLWLRLARTGARFIGNPEPTALYHTSSGSMSRSFVRLATGAAEVLSRARKPDWRVARPAAEYADGLGDPATSAVAYFRLWAATAAATADGAVPPALVDIPLTDLAGQGTALAETIRDAISVGGRIREDKLGRKWLTVQPLIASKLAAIENMSTEAGLCRRIVYHLEKTLLRSDPLMSPLQLSLMRGERVAMDRLPAWDAPGDLLHLRICDGAHEVFRVEVPCWGAVSADEIARLVGAEIGEDRLLRMRHTRIRWTRVLGRMLRTRGLPSTGELNRLGWRPLYRRRSQSEKMRRQLAAEIESDIKDTAAATSAPPLRKSHLAGDRARQDGYAPTRSIPILMYHKVTDEGPAEMARDRLSIARFKEQIAFLRAKDFYAVTSPRLALHHQRGEALPGRPVMLTFDGGYRDFHENAWPILDTNGFQADVFIVTGKVGGTSDWDCRFGAPQRLMTWNEIAQLAGKGIAFGSHLVTHKHVDALSTSDLFDEALRSRRTLEKKLRMDIRAIAAPFGGLDERSIRIFDAAGYHLCYSTRAGMANLEQNALDLPRIVVTGDMSLDAFAYAVGLT
jgi:peptidoglycan/xylan/chitin deacetylase (PgdA/CDA1 family)